MKSKVVIVILFILSFLNLNAQKIITSPTIDKNSSKNIQSSNDSIKLVEKIDSPLFSESFKPNPKKAVILSAIFPGLGQIYNRKYWKLPIIYGGFAGVAYAISWNNKYYQDYYNGYFDIMDNDPNTTRWYKFVPYGSDPKSSESLLKDRLKRGKDFYRRNRDLSIIIGVGLYALNIVDAYVDAQLFDFDISPDISMHVSPSVNYGGNPLVSNSYGLQLAFQF